MSDQDSLQVIQEMEKATSSKDDIGFFPFPRLSWDWLQMQIHPVYRRMWVALGAVCAFLQEINIDMGKNKFFIKRQPCTWLWGRI